MNFTPNPLQTLFLWALLANDGEQFAKRIKPELKAKDRKALEDAGLVKVEKRKEPDARKGARAIAYIVLSEQGWDWAARNLDAELSTRSPASGPILRRVLGKLKAYLERNQTALADFICCPPRSPEAGSEDNPQDRGDLSQRIRDAYCQASGGRWNVRVRLADLRPLLAGLSREDLDAAILSMERAGALVLYPLDDPQEIRPEDEAGAIPNSLGIRRHILYVER